jgi:hypothetical protein
MDPVFSEKKLYKRMRGDIETIREMITRVNDMADETRYTYLLSSSGILNSDILKNAYLPEVKYATKNLLYTYDVDKRDGFPDSFFTADIVIVAEPVQYHLDPAEQQIVGIPAEMILEGRADTSLKEIASYALDGGVTARVYRKQAPYTHAFLKELSGRMRAAYPAHPFISDTASVYAYLYDLELESGKNLYVNAKDSFALEIGAEQAGFKLNLERAFQKVTLTVTADGENAAGKSVRVLNDRKEERALQPLTQKETTVHIDANNCENLSVQFVPAEAEAAPNVRVTVSVTLE